MPDEARLFREACLIDGRWIETADAWIDVDNPATGEVIGRVPKLGAAEAQAAIDAAERAMPAWAALTAKERANILRRWYDLIMAHQEPLARILTREQGKPLAEAKGEIAYAASFIEWFAEEAKRVYGEVIPGHLANARIVVLKQPIGVVAAITPWNFPAAMITRKLGPALAAGCATVLKPASQTPFTALALAVLAEEAGIPKGLINVVTGSAAAIGETWTASPVVRKLTFTGSTEIGAKLYEQSAPTIKKLSLELGGNAPFLVFDDADVDAAVAGAIASKYRNAGQTCVCANRLYVQSGIHDAFVAKLVEAVGRLKVGKGEEEGTQIGPLIDEAAVAKAQEHVDDVLAKGGAVLAGGKPLGGRFFQPTVLTGVKPGMIILKEETFGPVAPIVKFETEAEAIALANDSEFGLAAYFYAQNLGLVWRVAEAIESGIIGINTGIISTEVAPFGGVKLSGLGREGSRHGIEDYLEIKYLCMDIG
ncbi:NAD-dependent succinate-semialdehyde dehydrogenase [Sphingomonas sp. CGMCC 1.13654]|uniref:NAD-dependent succinate-semialdehyde dehydrogenase n=1 Tax=Sphingomonas chungangi TaxID=2683589 RepID=A0A838L2P4_9SPHN|nr:NAD-dependent succinate-semialdehyde dehydrogenase [Sphingomonas chungangi]MBA2932689.1 NAD-dependent succinate-semialdehyde dehydrogenase [Sphingomonas chungangi]MVW56311.1 succinate-semialdehyde dehydrogenase [Sphingomonas chungangi]